MRVLHNYLTASNGRVWLLWDSNRYNESKKSESSQMLHCEVRGITAEVECDLTIIYRFNTNEQRKELWESLKLLAQGITVPWLVIGDFNALLDSQDRLHRNLVHQSNIQDLAECI